MDDKSQLNFRAVSADPGESALLLLGYSTVNGGKCEKQTFPGVLERRR